MGRGPDRGPSGGVWRSAQLGSSGPAPREEAEGVVKGWGLARADPLPAPRPPSPVPSESRPASMVQAPFRGNDPAF